ncbi:family 6 glucosyltransferase [Chitinophaga alhagiae]|uniref:family 6 glucosyltransferase n=1 Tax=Chitinophaga alhagiae TaxID=2203219 RepID=UPI000E5C01D1|nr:family 6 glucosyltransferase [Chitinophaga alhagiae]
MKIALLFIGTGKYSIFWEGFFTSAEQYFIPAAQKEYFVFTDDAALPYKNDPKVHVYHQERLGWPYDTLMRFSIFYRAEKALRGFDYIFFFNANAEFIRPISAGEILPGLEHNGLTVVLHPGYYNKPAGKLPYERSRKSTAFMPRSGRQQYFQGCLNGGTGAAYMQLVETLMNNTQADLDRGIIAVWHDESHLNSYMAGRHPKVLTPAYAYPEGWELPFTPAISMRDKARFGGHGFMRQIAPEQEKTLLQRVIRRLKRLFSCVLFPALIFSANTF